MEERGLRALELRPRAVPEPCRGTMRGGKKTADAEGERAERGESAARPPLDPLRRSCGRRFRVLICGHSMVCCAEHYAKKSQVGAQLGLSDLATVEWCGVSGLRWSGLRSLLFGEPLRPPPDVLVIHLGGNDLGQLKGKALILQAIDDFHYIKSCWPGVAVVFSAMVSRRAWTGNADPKCLEIARRRANREIRNALRTGLGYYIPHCTIVFQRPELYMTDGVHLSDEGNQLFVEELQQGVKAVLAGLLEERE